MLPVVFRPSPGVFYVANNVPYCVSGAFIQDTSRIQQTVQLVHMRYEKSEVSERSIRQGTLLGVQSAFWSVSRLAFEGFSRHSTRRPFQKCAAKDKSLAAIVKQLRALYLKKKSLLSAVNSVPIRRLLLNSFFAHSSHALQNFQVLFRPVCT